MVVKTLKGLVWTKQEICVQKFHFYLMDLGVPACYLGDLGRSRPL